jgi:hypothetical protein
MHDDSVRRFRRGTIGLLILGPLVGGCGAKWFISRPAPSSVLSQAQPVPPSLEFFRGPSEAFKDSAAVRAQDDSSKRATTSVRP